MSSWLNRVAVCYQMDMLDLLEHDLGHGQVDDLDTAPPMSLLTALSQRSGIELDRLRDMSFAGWVPWLLDSFDDRLPAALKPMRSSSWYCCRSATARRDQSRDGERGCPANRLTEPARSV